MMFCAVSVFAQSEYTDNQGVKYTRYGATATVSGHTKKLNNEITIPATIPSDEIGWCRVTSIGEHVFGACTSLTSVTIPNSVWSIGSGAFSGCKSLASVTIPNSVTSIADLAFSHTALTSVTIPNSVTSIDEYAFSHTALTSVTIPNSVTSIDEYAFAYCENLTSIIIPNSVTSIETRVFYECTSITDVYCFANPNHLTWYDGIPNTKFHVLSNYLDAWNSKFQDVANITFAGDLRKITYHLNGGTLPSGTSNPTYTVESGAIPLATPTKPAYYFIGWFDNPELSGDAITEVPAQSTGTKDFYAKWSATEYSITYHLNGGTLPSGTSNPTTYTVESGAITLPTTPTHPYGDFIGWFDNPDFSGNAITEVPAQSTGNKDFYAKWSIKSNVINISSVEDLKALAKFVNDGGSTEGRTYFLTDDIDFNPAEGDNSNLAPIGSNEAHPFKGTFDGCNHTIKGVRVHKEDFDSGLFGNSHGTIKNVILDGAIIYGLSNRGGISGANGGTIENCIVSNSYIYCAVNSTYWAAGGLVGTNKGTLSNNLVINTTVGNATGVGVIIGDKQEGSKLSNNFYYNSTANGIETNVGFRGNDIIENNGAVLQHDLIIDGDSENSVSISETKENQTVIYTRTLTKDIPTTIILPFDFTAAAFGNDEFYTFTGVDETTWEATMTEVAKGADNVVHLNANTPYIFKPSEETAAKSEFVFRGVTISPTTGDNTTEVGDWKFHGTYEKILWNEDPTKTHPKTTTNVYGFAAKAGTNNDGESYEAGEFVRAGYNVSIKPTRAYLEYKVSNENLSKSALVLPDRIKVVFIDHETASVIDDPTVNPSENENGDISTPTSEIQPTANVKVWSYDKTIFIQSRPGTDYRIIDANGRLLRASTTQTDRDEVRLGRGNGIVIVIIGGKAYKVNY